MANISFAITACNEHVELDRLLSQLLSSIRDEDEIIVQMDVLQNDIPTLPEDKKKVLGYIMNLQEQGKIRSILYPLNNDFASFKNNLKSHCTKDWIFFIDADEYLSDALLLNIHEILGANKGIVDVISVPRINTVEGLTREHIDKWRWFVDDNGYVNYPDYQTRICANKKDIEWKNKVHERLSGWKTIANLPHGYDLIHPKTIERQEKQNSFYDTI
jgi:glycosyltransferase involved in cell wall biosynthesis